MIRRFARPYARAIMDVTGSPASASQVREELSRFETARSGAADLRDVYANPGIDLDTKMKITRAIGGKLGLSETSSKVVEVLIRNHRINDLASVVEALAEMIRRQTGTVAAEVRSAHRLSDSETASLQRTLEGKVGKKVELTVVTDPTLLGGFVARIDSEIWDASVIGKINKFRESLA